jgi:hypothetical protein
MPQDKTGEVLDRTRRIEIRLTRLMEALNVETGVYRPVWDDGVVLVPSHMSSLADCMKVIPGNWPKDREVPLVMKDQVIAKLKVM